MEASAMLFIDNKYTREYFKIIGIAQNHTYQGYTERHHIIPKSLGGSNDPDNLVRLSAREHFICHRLLTKMLTGEDRKKMCFAMNWMTGTKKHRGDHTVSSRTYQTVREDFIDSMKGHKNYLTEQSPEARAKISVGLKKTLSKKSPEEISERMRNSCCAPHTYTKERSSKISKATTGVKKTKTPKLLEAEAQRKNRSAESKRKCGAKHKGRTWILINSKRVWIDKE